jgi:hypothetical protein
MHETLIWLFHPPPRRNISFQQQASLRTRTRNARQGQHDREVLSRAFAMLEDLGVVRRNDQNVVEPNGVLAPIAIDPRRLRLQDLGNKFADRLASSTEAL